jgi:3-methyl-2-oxobutanoate hydroxymethyltransferase
MPDTATTTSDVRVTLRTLRKWAREGQPFPMLTCYDATTAGWLWKGGVQTMLVGDTAAQMILGHDSTLPVSVPFMVEITAAVRRGAANAFVMADMPFGSYQASNAEAVRNAIRFMTDGGADVVKLEVSEHFLPLVKKLAAAGVPVVAHIGSRPQQVRVDGGFHSAARTREAGRELVSTAVRMVDAGAAMLLIEAVPAEVSAEVVKAVNSTLDRPGDVPIIGCGAGPACHGHVVVLHDLLGLTTWQPPFAKPVTQLGQQIEAAASKWSDLIRSGEYLKHDHPYKLKD